LERPVRAKRRRKSALPHEASALRTASRAGSWTSRFNPTRASNGADTAGLLSARLER
jgi:hypothetical protein